MDIRDFSLDAFSLAGKNAVITGGNTGLGQAFTLALAKAGADVFVPSVLDDDGITRELVEAEGRRMEFLDVDITEDGAPRRVIEDCVSRLGSVDVLVNSAGICRMASVEDFGREQWDPMLDINLTAPFELGREAARFMTEQRSGKIINIASLFSFLGGQWSPAYAATKHGIVGFTKAYCDELAQHNIQVNAIAPGYFATEMTRPLVEDPEFDAWVRRRTPAARWGRPDELVGALLFLASPASDFVNGQTLFVDGGMSAVV
jgi:NAD(P)-dependent dehydrogenase (short-subunit alcohol dehydrogenase family)